MFDIENILQPANLADALRLAGSKPDAIIIAGGTDVLIQVREGKLAGRELLSIHDIPELQGIDVCENGDIIIGPLSRFVEVERHELIRRHLPILAAAAGTVGGPQIRSQGTIGGNVANGVTSADTASTLHALEAQLLLESHEGSRILPIKDFHLGPGKTARQPGELLTKIVIKQENFAATGGCYLKYAMREAMDIATLGCAVLLRPDAAGESIERIRVAFGVAAPVPMRAEAAEQALTGLALAEATECIAELVRQEIKPRDSWRASRDFRLQIAGELAKRALAAAWAQAMEGRLPR